MRTGLAAWDEELFDTAAVIISAENGTEAIQMANDSRFGLGAAVFTQDLNRDEKIAAEESEAENCFVNNFEKSGPRLPFGDIKECGDGCELSSFDIREFVNVKTVSVK